MHKVNEVNFQMMWTPPVFVRIGSGLRERIDGPEAALQALTHGWPVCDDKTYSDAKLQCLEALVQFGSVERARNRFISAALVAGIFA
ncbi:DUF982 domain-containing protein [Rhizobium sp. BK251]|uniref:DUF982 domain-containing protein n=1 Tax=Rhizobium sp. BK251 TaxID=2512125 RepID=UPI0010515605|nr:DUF982 domain-containing protein [Rhizobium sp. BK251]TCL66393.1 uncharacterized protein DUF982 [Rhizobium sp. BK251]